MTPFGRTPAKPAPSPLAGTTNFVLPVGVVRDTLDVLAEAGRAGHEAFVVWGAAVDEGTVRFRSALVPEQQPHRTPSGLLVTVDGAALFRVNKLLYERGEVLAGQVHSHPTNAFHSDTDDCHSLVTLTGALSIVVPDFARGGLDGLPGWAWYRLVAQSRWEQLNRHDKIEFAHAESDD